MWFRRDLRLEDNNALCWALSQCKVVHCLFVFDKTILDQLPKRDRRVEFIHASVLELNAQIRNESGGGLIVRHAHAPAEVLATAISLSAQAVFANHDYEPMAVARDSLVSNELDLAGIAWHTFKDQVVFEREEVLTQAGKPFSVFTPYKGAWLKKLNDFYLAEQPSQSLATRLANHRHFAQQPIPTLSDMGFEETNLKALNILTGASGGLALLSEFSRRIDQYTDTRNFPAVKGPSYLGVHLRFGTVSIRKLVSIALSASKSGSSGAATWLSELIWRDFYFQILANSPHVTTDSFKPAYDSIQWEEGEDAQVNFKSWCDGTTGYPLVDAAMAQINQTGYMHNRLRMLVASFLTKDLGIDWRWGERYFAEKLNDFDLSANNGGWQWAASSGCDAQPYFRIFNPITQSQRFDAQGKFIRRYLPQLGLLSNTDIHAPWLAKPLTLQSAGIHLGRDYPYPIVDHATARVRTLARYAVVKQPQSQSSSDEPG